MTSVYRSLILLVCVVYAASQASRCGRRTCDDEERACCVLINRRDYPRCAPFLGEFARCRRRYTQINGVYQRSCPCDPELDCIRGLCRDTANSVGRLDGEEGGDGETGGGAGEGGDGGDGGTGGGGGTSGGGSGGAKR